MCNMRKLTTLSILIASLLGCSGCWEQRELNTTAIVTGWGVDLSKNPGYLDFSTQLAQPGQPGEGGQVKIESLVLTAQGLSVTEAARRTMLILPRIPLWPHAGSCILGEQLVSNDLTGFYDFALRNRLIRPDTNLLIAKGTSVAKILDAKVPLTSSSGRVFLEMENFQEEQLGIYVPVSLNDFLIAAFSPGIEPAVPQISLINDPEKLENGDGQNDPSGSGEKLVLDGTAVFKGKRMVGSLNENESRGYRWLNPRVHKGGFFLIPSPSDPGKNIALRVINFSSSVHPVIDQEKLTMKINLAADLTFYEQTGANPNLDADSRAALEALAAQEIYSQVQACIEKSQSLNSDILGWGRIIYREQPRQWEAMHNSWDQIFPVIGNNIEIKTQILRTNLEIHSFQFAR